MILIIGGCGYIGSALFPYLENRYGKIVDTLDLEWWGNYVNPNNKVEDYAEVDHFLLEDYNVIILLAAHSSVGMCDGRREDSFQNNVVNFLNILENIDHQKFIYMSSSSVYNRNKVSSEDTDGFVATNYYDLSKYIDDAYAKMSGKNYYGLRLGTVNGFSANLRSDIMLNKMFLSAINDGEITMQNPAVRRPILGMNDLCRAICAIIDKEYSMPGIYNVASGTYTVGSLAGFAGEYCKVPVIGSEGTTAYDFAVNTLKFQKYFEFSFEETPLSILESLDRGTYHVSDRGPVLYAS